VTTKVLVVDDQALLRTAFSSLIDAEDDLEVVGEAADGREAVQVAARLGPDVVVMDVRMPVMDGIEATRQIAAGQGAGVPRVPTGRSIVTTTWDLITTKNLEIRKRRGLMITVVVLIIVPTVLFYGLRLLFHAVDPHGYALAGSPQFFSQATNLIDEFGFIAAAALGAAAGTTDLSDGMFRHLVITGRSRLALYLARIPAGLAITVPLVALVFMMNCLVTSYDSPPNPRRSASTA
jgi:CheY-like chemotaxis protein